MLDHFLVAVPCSFFSFRTNWAGHSRCTLNGFALHLVVCAGIDQCGHRKLSSIRFICGVALFLTARPTALGAFLMTKCRPMQRNRCQRQRTVSLADLLWYTEGKRLHYWQTACKAGSLYGSTRVQTEKAVRVLWRDSGWATTTERDLSEKCQNTLDCFHDLLHRKTSFIDSSWLTARHLYYGGINKIVEYNIPILLTERIMTVLRLQNTQHGLKNHRNTSKNGICPTLQIEKSQL